MKKKGLLADIVAATENSVDGYAQDILFDLMDFVESSMNKKHLTRREIAKAAEMKEPQFSRLLRAEGNPTILTIAKIFKALGERPALTVRNSISTSSYANTSTVSGLKVNVKETIT